MKENTEPLPLSIHDSSSFAIKARSFTENLKLRSLIILKTK